MTHLRTLTQNQPKERNGLVARACYTSEFHSRISLQFGGPLEKTQRSSEPKFKGFEWLE